VFGRAISLVYGPDYSWFRSLEETVQKELIGPDCYWKDPSKSNVPGCRRFFGNAWWIPFPPSLVCATHYSPRKHAHWSQVIRYDDGSVATLREIAQVEEYVRQNTSPDVSRRREIRLTLRALDGKIVAWPYEHIIVSSPLRQVRVSHVCAGSRVAIILGLGGSGV